MTLVRKLHAHVVSLREIELPFTYRLTNAATILCSLTLVTGIRPVCTYQVFVKKRTEPCDGPPLTGAIC